MIRPDFKLVTDDDAKTVQAALDQLCPILGDQDKAAENFTHTRNEFTFARGRFFDKLMGFVLTTDASGIVTSVKCVLKLP